MKAFLFDLDGTLVDTEPMWCDALRAGLAELDCVLTAQQADELVYGRSWHDIHVDLCLRYPGVCDDRMALEGRFGRHFAALKEAGDCSLQTSVKLLIRLAQERPVAIVSGSSRQMVGEWIEDLELDPHIHFYLGCDDYPAGKPDPVCYRMAADQLGLTPDACLVFEDSSAGVLAAKSAGMYCVALRRHGAHVQDLSAADCIVGDLAELDPEGLIQKPPQFRSV